MRSIFVHHLVFPQMSTVFQVCRTFFISNSSDFETFSLNNSYWFWLTVLHILTHWYIKFRNDLCLVNKTFWTNVSSKCDNCWIKKNQILTFIAWNRKYPIQTFENIFNEQLNMTSKYYSGLNRAVSLMFSEYIL